jgi:hypothetical protein
MRLISVFLGGTLFCLMHTASANPIFIDPYAAPFISEVQKTDSVHWAIELDDAGNCVSAIRPPCVTSILMLRVASSKKIYNFKTTFDTARIAVLTQDSIFGIPKTEKVVIRPFDTVQILDTGWQDTGYKLNLKWSFPVRPVAPGNSLVDFWSKNSYSSNNTPPFETTRSSIGSKGNYSTLHQLYLMDQNGNPLPQVYIYRYIYVMDYTMGMGSAFRVALFLRKITSSMTFLDSIPLKKTGDTLAFCSDSFTQNYGGPYSSVLKWPPSNYQWSGAYIDTVVSMNDTIVLPWATAIKKTKPLPTLPTVRFSSLCSPAGKITFIVATPSALADASIQVTGMSGKIITSLSIPVNRKGTHSVSWDGTDNRHKRLPRGTYVCRLSEQGKVIGSQTIRLY